MKNKPSFGELIDAIEDAPQTWLPALLVKVTGACVRKNVFMDNGALLRVVLKSAELAKSPSNPGNLKPQRRRATEKGE